MILTKLNRYIYEAEFKDKLKLKNLSLDKVLEIITKTPEDERDSIISQLSPEVKEKIEEIRKGGLL